MHVVISWRCDLRHLTDIAILIICRRSKDVEMMSWSPRHWSHLSVLESLTLSEVCTIRISGQFEFLFYEMYFLFCLSGIPKWVFSSFREFSGFEKLDSISSMFLKILDFKLFENLEILIYIDMYCDSYNNSISFNKVWLFASRLRFLWGNFRLFHMFIFPKHFRRLENICSSNIKLPSSIKSFPGHLLVIRLTIFFFLSVHPHNTRASLYTSTPQQ